MDGPEHRQQNDCATGTEDPTQQLGISKLRHYLQASAIKTNAALSVRQRARANSMQQDTEALGIVPASVPGNSATLKRMMTTTC